MQLPEAVVVRTGTANLASVISALLRAGFAPRVSQSPADVRSAPALVLPGVGAFGSAMTAIRQSNLADALAERVVQGRPTLCICLGLQMLAQASEESGGVRGLGVIPAHVRRFEDTVRTPQLGWNSVAASEGCNFLRSGYAYFANSYRLCEVPPGWSGAIADYGGPFVAAIERGQVLACQFHPELSGEYGADLLRRWRSAAVTSETAPC